NSVESEGFDLAKINLNFSDLAGVIMVGIYHEDFVLKLQNMELPMVLVDENIPSEDIQTVLIDNTDGIIRACKFLAELGHKRVAYLSKEKNEASAYERYYGFKHSCELFGFDKDEALVAETQMRIDSAFESMMSILDRVAEPPTAVLAYNDIIALGAMAAIHQRGLSIPGDVSVVGFDDIRLARESVPPLTTVHVPKRLMGAVAVQRLLHVIQGRNEPLHKVLIPTRLKVRESTGPPKGAVGGKGNTASAVGKPSGDDVSGERPSSANGRGSSRTAAVNPDTGRETSTSD
ncbi:MAG TPA: substrate-binding domain-containing protein, partial [Spirochaetia bacterium]|nr:substrate-binding domain-containing protein [Spirochaetia bacterium]